MCLWELREVIPREIELREGREAAEQHLQASCEEEDEALFQSQEPFTNTATFFSRDIRRYRAAVWICIRER